MKTNTLTGHLPDPTIEQYTQGAWTFAMSVLWPHKSFSDFQNAGAIQHIRDYFTLALHPRKAFRPFCERIILQSQELRINPEDQIAIPGIYFHPECHWGFARTQSKLDKVIRKRRQRPGYMRQMQVTAVSYRSYIEQPEDVRAKHRCIRLMSQLLRPLYTAVFNQNHINLQPMQVLQQQPDGSVQIELTPMSGISLAKAYGVSIKTFNRWMTPIRTYIGPKVGRYYTITQVRQIFEKLGMPSSIMQG